MNEPEPTIEVGNHQDAATLGEFPKLLEVAAPEAVRIAWAARVSDDAPLGTLDALDVALVDDESIAAVHRRFLGDPMPTDVITFDHGEILIGVETAVEQSADHGEPLWRELLRYFVHGLLHLSGHDDHEEAERATMHREQEKIVAELWERHFEGA
jgi:probable rRNA maturation factor